MGRLGELSYFVFYSSLAFTAFSILFYGPITNIYKDETVFSENLQILNGKTGLQKQTIFSEFIVKWSLCQHII